MGLVARRHLASSFHAHLTFRTLPHTNASWLMWEQPPAVHLLQGKSCLLVEEEGIVAGKKKVVTCGDGLGILPPAGCPPPGMPATTFFPLHSR